MVREASQNNGLPGILFSVLELQNIFFSVNVCFVCVLRLSVADTAAILRVHELLWLGEYDVALEVKDEQGYACPEPQKVTVQVCTCEDGVLCGKKGFNGQVTKGAELGPAGIGLLLLGLLLLLRKFMLMKPRVQDNPRTVCLSLAQRQTQKKHMQDQSAQDHFIHSYDGRGFLKH